VKHGRSARGHVRQGTLVDRSSGYDAPREGLAERNSPPHPRPRLPLWNTESRIALRVERSPSARRHVRQRPPIDRSSGYDASCEALAERSSARHPRPRLPLWNTDSRIAHRVERSPSAGGHVRQGTPIDRSSGYDASCEALAARSSARHPRPRLAALEHGVAHRASRGTPRRARAGTFGKAHRSTEVLGTTLHVKRWQSGARLDILDPDCRSGTRTHASRFAWNARRAPPASLATPIDSSAGERSGRFT
jgi:hypothetical protein